MDGNIVIKTRFGDDIRRFSIPTRTRSFRALVQTLTTIYEEIPENCFVKYKDDEGDLITVTSDAELTEAYRIASEQQNKTLYLSLFPADEAQGARDAPMRQEEEGEGTGARTLSQLSRSFSSQLERLAERLAKLSVKDSGGGGGGGGGDGDGDRMRRAESETDSEDDSIMCQLIEQMNDLMIATHPKKARYRYLLHDDKDTCAVVREAERHAAFKRLIWSPAKQKQYEEAVAKAEAEQEERRRRELEAEQLLKAQGITKKKRPKKKKIEFAASCQRCGDPMVQDAAGKNVCKRDSCVFRSY
eukprot:TRINITY_DN1890_c0_g1_i2.p1 TRINITY_DN1890_c0_g1~~TRINITY_DN1890_c0_g1_i2.p1  ORF type:complete len:301 (+),score=106.73 TRINITY_DN1890_c0_g1_i2:163-1065(+)